MPKPKGEGSARSYFDFINDRSLSSVDEPIHEILSRPGDLVNEDSLYSSLICTGTLQGHNGCINAMDWSESGRLLASGSDDQKLIIWNAKSRELQSRINTVHVQNIFGVSFLSGREDQVVTVAGDGRVQLHQLYEDGTPPVGMSAVWHDNEDRVKKVEVHAEEPNLFWTASEDGTIRQYDIRLPASQAGLRLADWSEMQISLNSLSISPLRPWYIATGGTGPVVRVFDRRLVSPDRSTSTVQFLFDRIWMPVQKSADTTCAVKFRRNSMELIASMVNDNIYRIDFDLFRGKDTIHLELSSYLTQEASRYSQLMLKWKEGKFNDYYFAISEMVSEHRGLQYGIIRYLNEIYAYEIEARLLAAIHLNRLDDALSDADILWSNEAELGAHVLKSAFLTFLLSKPHAILCQDILERREELDDMEFWLHRSKEEILSQLKSLHPIHIPDTQEWKEVLNQRQIYFGFAQRYTEHVNVQTIKDVTFLGSHDDYICSGSDAGFFFIWRREGGELLFVGRSDNHVVNNIEQHPKLPLIAVSGIDNDIKLWEPGQGPEDDRQVNDWRAVSAEYRSQFLEQLQAADHVIPVVTIPCHIQ